MSDAVTVNLSVRRDVVFDELCEMTDDIVSLVRLIPLDSAYEAAVIVERMERRLRAWVSIEVEK
jgi:hypothetical protein